MERINRTKIADWIENVRFSSGRGSSATKNNDSRSQRPAAATESQKPKAKSEEPPLDLFRLVVVFHSAVFVILARDVVIGINVAGFSDTLRFIRGGRRARACQIRPASASFFASTLFRARTFCMRTLFMSTLFSKLFMPTFFVHRDMHRMPFSSNCLGIQVNPWRDQRSTAALVPHGHGVNRARRSLNLRKRRVSRA